MSNFDSRTEFRWYKIGIIGSGPAGLSAAAHAAELGVSHILFEAEDHASNTIYKYQKGTHVMAEPAILPLRSPMEFKEGKREEIIGAWDEGLTKHKVNIKYNTEVTGIEGTDNSFQVKTKSGESFFCRKIIVAIGLQGNIRKLGVAGENLEQVQYQHDDPKAYEDETIVVVGAGDAAIENAIGLAEQNRVVMINRNEEFARCKEGNLTLVLAAIKDGKVECRYGSSPTSVELTGADPPLKISIKTPDGPDIIEAHRVIARLGATPPRKLVEGFGIKFPRPDPTAIPELTDKYESNVPGIYINGALGGYPLIKQAMNQGYETVEYALGKFIEPADEPLLLAKFQNFSKTMKVGQVLDVVQESVPLLKTLNRLQLREFMLDSDLRTPKQGEIIFQRNDYTNSFYMMVGGTVEVESLEDGKHKGWFPIGAGQFFGELGLISGRRRSSTVRAGANCVLLEAPRRPMLTMVASHDAIR